MSDLPASLKIRTKAIHVMVTNACNLTCGGCNQLIGHFPREKIFFTPIDEIRSNIRVAIRVARLDWHQPWFPAKHRHLSLYGGEPTVHPDWHEITRMVQTEFSDWPFVVLTNGRTFAERTLPQSGDRRFSFVMQRRDINAHEGNVFWRIDPKYEIRRFVPTLIAPIDQIGNPDPDFYYALARKNCCHWQHCETLIYRNKGYFCVNAGPMDWLFHDGQHGWDLDQPHPFDRTDEEIGEQARLFCFRCNYCLGTSAPVYGSDGKEVIQSSGEKSRVSETNFAGISLHSGCLVQLAITPPARGG